MAARPIPSPLKWRDETRRSDRDQSGLAPRQCCVDWLRPSLRLASSGWCCSVKVRFQNHTSLTHRYHERPTATSYSRRRRSSSCSIETLDCSSRLRRHQPATAHRRDTVRILADWPTLLFNLVVDCPTHGLSKPHTHTFIPYHSASHRISPAATAHDYLQRTAKQASTTNKHAH